MRIYERQAQFYRNTGISNITKTAYLKRKQERDSYSFNSLIIVDDKDIRLRFLVMPTKMTGKPLSNGPVKSLSNQYIVEIQFVDADKYVDLDHITYRMDKNVLISQVQEMFDNCDLKFYSDDPSFYWQGFWGDLDSVDSAIYPFKGEKGTGVWENRHTEAGGLTNSKYRVTKHILQILNNLNEHKVAVATKLLIGDYEDV